MSFASSRSVLSARSSGGVLANRAGRSPGLLVSSCLLAAALPSRLSRWRPWGSR
jgi:hypothetical protein